jgi:thioredoxin reductase
VFTNFSSRVGVGSLRSDVGGTFDLAGNTVLMGATGPGGLEADFTGTGGVMAVVTSLAVTNIQPNVTYGAREGVLHLESKTGAAKPFAKYDFETSLTADSSGYGRNLVASGAVTWIDDAARGGKVAHFEGAATSGGKLVATGAKARKLPIPGASGAIEAIDYLLGNQEVGERVVVIGGGLTGCEIAYDLYLKGKKPTVVEMQDDLVTTPGICLANTSYLRDFFHANKVPVHLETSVSEIGEGKVTVKHKDGTAEEIETDSVVLSVGYVPTPVAKKGGKVHVIGDAANVGNLRTVIWGAWDVAMKL